MEIKKSGFLKKNTVLSFLFFLFLFFPVFGLDYSSTDGTATTTPTAQNCQVQASQLGQLLAANSQLSNSLAELKANSATKADFNAIIPPILEYYQNETIAREMIVLVVFLVFLGAGLALLKIKRFF